MTGGAATGSAKTAELETGFTRGTQRDGTPRSEISTARRRAIDSRGAAGHTARSCNLDRKLI